MDQGRELFQPGKNTKNINRFQPGVKFHEMFTCRIENGFQFSSSCFLRLWPFLHSLAWRGTCACSPSGPSSLTLHPVCSRCHLTSPLTAASRGIVANCWYCHAYVITQKVSFSLKLGCFSTGHQKQQNENQGEVIREKGYCSLENLLLSESQCSHYQG